LDGLAHTPTDLHDENLAPISRIVSEVAAQFPGARITLETDPIKAVALADFVYTDVWVSMGEPDAVWKERIAQLMPYQVNAALMRATCKPRSHFMHCLPAFHNLDTEVGRQIHERYGLSEIEVTDEVFESDASIVFSQAENRLHTIKAVLVATLA
jgi:ornithine carbamoyltransferase